MSSFLKILLFLAVMGIIYDYSQPEPQKDAVSSNSHVPFVSLALPIVDYNPELVLVLAADNCPREESQRAYKLVDDLLRNGIPVVQQSKSPNFRSPYISNQAMADQVMAKVDQINSILSSPVPIVIVRGRAKSNPTLDEVIAEYERGLPSSLKNKSRTPLK